MIDPDLPPGARVLRRGSFRLDRRRAQEKIARFQLDDPHAYILELIAAGVCAGAGQIEVRTGLRDLEIAWEGDTPTQPELRDLFEWIFARAHSQRARMLQHLAQGIYGARGIVPAAIVLDVPGVRADLTDPLRPQFTEGELRTGARVTVREHLKLMNHTVGALSWLFGLEHEHQLLRRRAALCRTPIRLGRSLVGVDTLALPAASEFHHVADDAFLWLGVDARGQRLAEHYPALMGARGTVAIVRDGLIVREHRQQRGQAALCGWIHADELQLDVSQSNAIEDDRWRALVEQLAGILDELLARSARPHRDRQPRDRQPPLAPQRRATVAEEVAESSDDPEDMSSEISEDLAAATPADDAVLPRPDAPAPAPACEQTPDDAPSAGEPSDAGPAAPPPSPAAPLDGPPRAPLAVLHAGVELLLATGVDLAAIERELEELLRERPSLGVAFMKDPSGTAGILLAWLIADRLLLASGKSRLALELAPRLADVLVPEAGDRRSAITD
jgi:hypothetical protein